MSDVNIRLIQMKPAAGLPLPDYATSGSAGMDLSAALSTDIVLAPGERAIVPTGLKIALPDSYEAQIRPRSGLAAKKGITVLNTPGTIDADYRGEICIILVNLSQESFTVSHGMRIAQMVIAPITKAQISVVESFDDQTERGAEGKFGSTGLF